MKPDIATFLRIYRTAAPDFIPDRRETFDGDERANRLKMIIDELPETDRALLIVYLQVGSARELGRLVGMTKQTAWRQIRAIKKKITEAYESFTDIP